MGQAQLISTCISSFNFHNSPIKVDLLFYFMDGKPRKQADSTLAVWLQEAVLSTLTTYLKVLNLTLPRTTLQSRIPALGSVFQSLF